jgi:predicted flap endonuclease-1-like 5' DNA nuclease
MIMSASDLSADREETRTMLERFRAERIANRPGLHATLRADRVALTAARAQRLGVHAPTAAPSPVAPPKLSPPETEPGPVSVFAQFVASERETLQCPASPGGQDQPDAPPEAETAAAVGADAIGTTSAQRVSAPGPNLDALGFGPGMTARLHHVGVLTVADMASADAGNLRGALGDVGDLVNVDHWISQAQTLLQPAE